MSECKAMGKSLSSCTTGADAADDSNPDGHSEPKRMTPRQVWERIRGLQAEINASPKVAGPWCRATEPCDGHVYEWRNKPIVGVAAMVGPDNRNCNELDDDFDGLGYFDTREEADKALRAAGWLLLDETP